MKILIIHHLETEWEQGYKRFDTSFEELLERFADYLSENHFDRVILTRFEEWQIDAAEYYPIYDYINSVKTYSYGHELESFLSDEEMEKAEEIQELLDDGKHYITSYGTKIYKGGNHSNVLPSEVWIEELAGHDVYISGAFDGECIEDLEIILNRCQVNYKRIEELII